MSDNADRAERLEADDRAHALQIMRDAIDSCDPQLHDGTTIICCDCLEPVDPERLRAIPAATRCLCCQAAHEQDKVDVVRHGI